MKTFELNTRRGALAESGTHRRFGERPEMMQQKHACSENTKHNYRNDGGSSPETHPGLAWRRHESKADPQRGPQAR